MSDEKKSVEGRHLKSKIHLCTTQTPVGAFRGVSGGTGKDRQNAGSRDCTMRFCFFFLQCVAEVICERLKKICRREAFQIKDTPVYNPNPGGCISGCQRRYR